MNEINLKERAVVYINDFVATYESGPEDKEAYEEFLDSRSKSLSNHKIATIVKRTRRTIDFWVKEVEEGKGKKPLYLRHGLDAVAELICNKTIKEPHATVLLTYGDKFFTAFNIMTAMVMASSWEDKDHTTRVYRGKDFLERLKLYLEKNNIECYIKEARDKNKTRKYSYNLTLGRYNHQISRMIAATGLSRKEFIFPHYIDDLEELLEKGSLAEKDKQFADERLKEFYAIVIHHYMDAKKEQPKELQSRTARFGDLSGIKLPF